MENKINQIKEARDIYYKLLKEFEASLTEEDVGKKFGKSTIFKKFYYGYPEEVNKQIKDLRDKCKERGDNLVWTSNKLRLPIYKDN